MKNSYLFALSAAASGLAAATPSVAAAVCECTLYDMIGDRIFTQGPSTFVYNGSSTTGYTAELVQDNIFGMTTDDAPQVWVDYDIVNTVAGVVNTSGNLCRTSYTGTQISCAGNFSKNSTLTAHVTKHEEVAVPVTGLYSAGNSPWDRYLLKIISPSVSSFKPSGIPTRLAACW